MTEWPFSSQSSKHHNSQTIRARDLKFWHNDHHPLCVLCHMSCVMCHVSHVTCHMSHVACHVSFVTTTKKMKKNGQSGGASRSRVCYERGLPRLVFSCHCQWHGQSDIWLLYASSAGDWHREVLRRLQDPFYPGADIAWRCTLRSDFNNLTASAV